MLGGEATGRLLVTSEIWRNVLPSSAVKFPKNATLILVFSVITDSFPRAQLPFKLPAHSRNKDVGFNELIRSKWSILARKRMKRRHNIIFVLN